MGNVVTLIGFRPPPREDGVPWTVARVLESATPTDLGVLIDSLVLVPDPDPSMPQVRNLTTVNGTLDTGWYRLVFADGNGNVSGPSDPVRSSITSDVLPPTPDEIRNGSPLLRQKYPMPPTDPFQTVDLRATVYQATAMVQAITWRTIDPTLGCAAPEGEMCELVPDALVPIAVQAVTRMAERLEVTTEPDFAAQVATGRRVRSISAGPWSESYFAPGEFARRGAQQGRPPMDADDALDSALWALATEAARDYFVWRATGKAPPAGVFNQFDYRKGSGGYSSGRWPLLGARSGPDGF